ncbi:pseudouridine synthase [Rhodomicrobium udaipurense]|uniref:Pseudouridine synthase n=1 Tax=Rhodomicrobium udaipurense TaxID=1202716 RepID=A0A8I1GGQ5_9HYPH|nr:pseudouridine synthase [Rhodomicrobium udaipurense]MBJ7544529.1 pseudouridine synthase [Rhodomicrobium udaipurense]
MPSPNDTRDQDTAGAERVAKVIARSGLCSRRDAEVLIGEKRVSVNGSIIESAALDVSPTDRVAVDGHPLPAREPPRLWRYHKPKGRVTTHKDPEGRPTVFEALPDNLPRLISIGRLDFNTEGLLLLTNDGELARHMELPSTGWARRYRVRAFGEIDQASLDKLKNGVRIAGINYGPVEASLERETGDNVWITLLIREGKNREVRRIMEHLGLTVNRLIRISFGPFMLGDLEPGQVEEVKTSVLKDQLGPRLARSLGVRREVVREEKRLSTPSRGKPTYLRRKEAEPERPRRAFEEPQMRRRRVLSEDASEAPIVELVPVPKPPRADRGERGEKRDFAPRDRGERSFDRPRDDAGGERRSFGRREDSGGERPAFRSRADGDRAPRVARDGDASERKPYPKRREGEGEGERRFNPRDAGDRPAFRKREGDRSERPSRAGGGERPPFQRRESDAGAEHRGDAPKQTWAPRIDATTEDHSTPRFKRREEGGEGRPSRPSDARGERRPFNRDARPEGRFDRKPRDGDAGGERRPFVRREDGAERPAFRSRSDGDRPARFARDGEGGERKSSTARPGFRSRDAGEGRGDARSADGSGERRSFRPREGGGERKSFGPREGADRPPFRKREGDRSERPSRAAGEDRPRFRRPEEGGDSARGPRPDRAPGDRPAYRSRSNEGGAGGERKSFDKPFRERREGFGDRAPQREGERPAGGAPFEKRGGAGGARTYGKKPFGSRDGAKSFSGRGGSGAGTGDKPFGARSGGAAGRERSGGEGGEGKPFGARKTFGTRGGKPGGGAGGGKFGKPFTRRDGPSKPRTGGGPRKPRGDKA